MELVTSDAIIQTNGRRSSGTPAAFPNILRMPRSKPSPSSEKAPDGYGDEFEFSSGDSSSGFDAKELLLDVLARWPWLVLGVILGVLGGLYYFSKAPKIYEATATLLVTQSGGDVSGVNDADELDFRSSEGLNTLAVQIKEREFLTRVAGILKLNETAMEAQFVPPSVDWFPSWARQWIGEKDEAAPPDPKEMSLNQLASLIGSWTSVGVVEFTRLLSITVEHTNPEIASLVANTIATEYEKAVAEERSDSRITSSTVLGQEAANLREEIQEEEKLLANYETTLEALADLKQLEDEFRLLQRRYKSKHPKFIDAQAALKDRRDLFLEEFDRVRNSTFDSQYWEKQTDELDDEDLSEDEQVRVKRRLLRTRATTLTNSIANQKSVLAELSTGSLKRMADRGSEAIGVESSSMSQVPGSPSKPEKTKVVSTGGFVGFGVFFLFVFLLVKMDNQVHTISQVERLSNLPVLATIRVIEPKVLQKIVKSKGESQVAQKSPTRHWDPHIVFRPGLTETLYVETFRILRASVALLGDEKKRNVTLFSSVLPGEGKTLVSTNFAIASAQQGKKTLLIDFDLRKPAVHKAFGIRRKQLKSGVTELLAGQISWKEALSERVGQDNLSCIFAGQKAPNPGELLSSDVVSKVLQTLEQEFDVIVIDSAPLLAVPDTRLIIPEVDNFVLVIRAEQTPIGAIRKGLSLMRDDGTDPAGVVVNAYEEKAGLLTRKYRYGYGYGGYGQYYGKGYSYGKYGVYGSDDDDD